MNKLKKFIYVNVIPFVGRLVVKKNKYCNVIYYHDIVAEGGHSFMQTNIDVFRQQMQYISEQGYETLSFDELNDYSKLRYAKKRILIAFDDGWKSNYDMIFDMMQKMGLKYNIYLTISKIGKDEDYLDWPTVKKMHESGLVGFGIHTYTHPDMSDLNKINKSLEFDEANKIFKKELSFEPEDFCYPFGSYSAASNEWIEKNQSYKRIYQSDMRYSYNKNGVVIFGRNGISNEDSIDVFVRKMKGYYNCWNTLFGILKRN